jgi:hypothetical protein
MTFLLCFVGRHDLCYNCDEYDMIGFSCFDANRVLLGPRKLQPRYLVQMYVFTVKVILTTVHRKPAPYWVFGELPCPGSRNVVLLLTVLCISGAAFFKVTYEVRRSFWDSTFNTRETLLVAFGRPIGRGHWSKAIVYHSPSEFLQVKTSPLVQAANDSLRLVRTVHMIIIAPRTRPMDKVRLIWKCSK